MKDLFTREGANKMIARINELDTSSTPLWGKMNVAQMLAHCNVTYELVYTDLHPKPTGIKKWLIKKFAKPMVVGTKPYAKNSRTAPMFIVVDEKEFGKEKARLIEHIVKTQELGAEHFDQLESHAFGPLSSQEWDNLFSKHLDHHLQQFGV